MGLAVDFLAMMKNGKACYILRLCENPNSRNKDFSSMAVSGFNSL
jgi:hypothetical protein